MENHMRALILSVLFLLPIAAHATVWDTSNQWDDSWEARYEAWVKSSWHVDVFRNQNSPYYTPKYPDCADSVYAMRAVFSFENGLPFAVLDSTTRNSLITNEIAKFDSLPAGNVRFVAFMNWLWDVTSTQTLPNDTYPVAITRDTVHSGNLMLAYVSKHSYSIKEVKDTGVPVLYYSTQANRGDLKIRSWPSVSYLFAGGLKAPSGIRGFRHPEDILKPVYQVPGYSDEEYQIPEQSWIPTIQAKLALRQETDDEALRRQMADVCELAQTRIDLVNQAEKRRLELGDVCLSASEYDDLSTPSRDGQAAAGFADLRATYQHALDNHSPLSPSVGRNVADIFAPSLRAEDGSGYCTIKYAPPQSMTLGEFRRRLEGGLISSNPNDPLTVRWGDERGPSEKAQRCPQY
jgi:hypothetical protein